MSDGRLRQQVGWDFVITDLLAVSSDTPAQQWLRDNSPAIERIRKERQEEAEKVNG